jgi:hypothetical protein
MGQVMKKLSVFLFVMVFFFAFAGMARAGVVFFEKFEDSSGFTLGGGYNYYWITWGITPLSGTATVPSNFVQGGSQDGNIFYGSFAKASAVSYVEEQPTPTMTLILPDLTGYNNLELIVSLAAPDGIWENSHRDSLHIIGGTSTTPPEIMCTAAGCLPVEGAIDSFLPTDSRSGYLRSSVHSIDLDHQFQDFRYDIDSSLKLLTFAFASTDYPEIIGIDSVRIKGHPVPNADLINPNLIINGSFETPDVSPGINSGPVGGWDVFYAPILGWTPATANGLEIQDHVIGSNGEAWLAYDGDQFAEPDAYANSGFFQTVDTIPGQEYNLSFAYSARPGVGTNSNIVDFKLNGTLIGPITGNGVGVWNTSWSLHRYIFTATGPSSTIMFMAAGISDGLGGFIDDVQLSSAPNLVPEPSSMLLTIDFEPNWPSGVTATTSFINGTSVNPLSILTNQFDNFGIAMKDVALVSFYDQAYYQRDPILYPLSSAAFSGVYGISPINAGNAIDYTHSMTFEFYKGTNPAETDYFSISTDKDSAGSTGNTITLYGYDLNNNFLGSTTWIETMDGGGTIILSGIGKIHKVIVQPNIRNPNFGGIGFDDVNFGHKVTPSPQTLHDAASGEWLGGVGGVWQGEDE